MPVKPYCCEWHRKSWEADCSIVSEEKKQTFAQGPRIRAHTLSETEYKYATKVQITEIVKSLYKDQQVCTHIDVYSPAENLMFRVEL